MCAAGSGEILAAKSQPPIRYDRNRKARSSPGESCRKDCFAGEVRNSAPAQTLSFSDNVRQLARDRGKSLPRSREPQGRKYWLPRLLTSLAGYFVYVHKGRGFLLGSCGGCSVPSSFTVIEPFTCIELSEPCACSCNSHPPAVLSNWIPESWARILLHVFYFSAIDRVAVARVLITTVRASYFQYPLRLQGSQHVGHNRNGPNQV
jgi:hypothetical protein